MKKSVALLMILALMLGVFAGCGNSSSGKKDDSNINETRNLVIAQGGYPQTLDIQYQSDVFASRPASMVFEKLVDLEPNGEFKGVLAESWDLPDETTIIFHLRKNVKFHNGDPMTAEDVKWSLIRAIESPYVGSKVSFIDKDAFKIIDDNTIEIHYLYPNASALYGFQQAGASILPSKLYANAESSEISANPIGTGPYKYVSAVNGESVTFVRNDEYWGEKAKIKNLIWQNISENANRTIELETGGASFAYDVPVTDITKIQDNKDLVLLQGQGTTIQAAFYNTETPGPLADVKVRKALGYAVDKKAILAAAYNNIGSVAKGPLLDVIKYSTQDLDVPEFDMDKAKAAMKEAGYGDGFNLRIYTNENQYRIDAAQVIQNAWKQLGVNTEITTLEYAAYTSAINTGDFDVCMFGWVSNGDPDNALYGLYHSTMIGGSNWAHTNDPKIDALLDQARQTLDDKARGDVYVEIQKALCEYYPGTWYYQSVNTNAYSAKLSNIEYTIYNYEPWTWEWTE